MYVQEKATKWQDNVEMDGLTTNGVLIMHPKGKFCGGNAKCGLWRETSLGGDVFSLRESRSAQQKGQPVSIRFNVIFFRVRNMKHEIFVPSESLMILILILYIHCLLSLM